MKAVIYHADGPIAKEYPEGLYKSIFLDFKEDAAKHNISTVHLTLTGHEGWGDENFYYDLDPIDIVYNREIAFTDFLSKAKDDVYWFTEPDSRINTMFPELVGDIALLRRNDGVAISPWFRLARPSALPIFKEVLDYFDLDKKTWHGDSVAFIKLWEEMGRPGWENIVYKNLNVELRNYEEYSKMNSMYTRQYKHRKKLRLFEK